jgi:hypothetical protein
VLYEESKSARLHDLNYFDEDKNKVLDLKRMKGGEPKLLVEDKKDETEPKFARTVIPLYSYNIIKPT